jgi:hypothetical protein
MNQHVVDRLSGIQQALIGLFEGGSSMSNATRGRERELFVDTFLSQVIGPPFRFGSGDITDSEGHRTGQLDVVVEYPFLPSLPMVLPNSPRLYLAEGVAAVIEVKSDLRSQWDEVERTTAAVRQIQRRYSTSVSFFGGPPRLSVPVFVVGYEGWATPEPLERHIAEGTVEAALVIRTGHFRSSSPFGGITARGPSGLWGLVCCLHQATSGLGGTGTRPINYLL